MQFVHLAECAPRPWRNGGGLTRELLAWPAAIQAAAPATADDPGWLVRVSVAEITADGPFSAYPGIDRWFAVLSGEGVRLGFAAGEQTRRAGEGPLFFAGESAPACTLLAGATQDLNLMVRRGPGGTPRAAMRTAAPGSVQRGRLPWRALYAHGAARLLADEDLHELRAGTLAWSDAHVAQTWELVEGAGAYWMSFEA